MSLASIYAGFGPNPLFFGLPELTNLLAFELQKGQIFAADVPYYRVGYENLK